MQVVRFLKSNMMLTVALAAAIATVFFVPIDMEYPGYFDLKTISCLFCVLAVVCALKNVNLFFVIASGIVKRFRNIRICTIALVYITFIGSMFITNDMALITFLPLGFIILSMTDMRRHMAYVFVLQNIAANLGGMLVPFGNPQNLYLFTKYDIPVGEFVEIMLLPFAASMILLTLCCLAIRPEPLELNIGVASYDGNQTIICLVLFALTIAVVFGFVPYPIGLIVVTGTLLVTDRQSLKMVDYSLIGTFAAFFVFSGNMARIPVVRELFSALLDKSALAVAALSSQVISNVPSAILLSEFTDDYRSLMLGVNIGGVGTLIASLAGLITYREYLKHEPGGSARFMGIFSGLGFGFLAVLLGLEYVTALI